MLTFYTVTVNTFPYSCSRIHENNFICFISI